MADKHRKMASGSEHDRLAPKPNGADPEIEYVEHPLGIAFGPRVYSPPASPKGWYRVEKKP
jgi:hypothetical protein